MKVLRVTMILTIVNLVILTLNLLLMARPAFAEDVPDVLRGRALEIVDTQGRVRASITVEPPITVESKTYPETVLFRMRDPQGPPRMKFSASEEGVGLDLVGESNVRVVIQSKGASSVKLVNKNGQERLIEP